MVPPSFLSHQSHPIFKRSGKDKEECVLGPQFCAWGAKKWLEPFHIKHHTARWGYPRIHLQSLLGIWILQTRPNLPWHMDSWTYCGTDRTLTAENMCIVETNLGHRVYPQNCTKCLFHSLRLISWWPLTMMISPDLETNNCFEYSSKAALKWACLAKAG